MREQYRWMNEKSVKIYLVRHAIAAEYDPVRYPDDDRPLTEEGINKFTAAATGLPLIIEKPNIIASSPLKRARQTAEIIASAYKNKIKVDIHKALTSGEDLGKQLDCLSTLAKKAASIIVVGHQPDLSLMAAALTGTKNCGIDFRKGAICRIDLDNNGGAGEIKWFLTQKVIAELCS